MKGRIQYACSTIPPTMMDRVTSSFLGRIRKYVENNGDHTEHSLQNNKNFQQT